MSIGVPLIRPVFASSNKPFGRDGDTDQEVIGPPSDVGVPEENGESLVRTNGALAYTINEGATSLTVISMVSVALPPVLLA